MISSVNYLILPLLGGYYFLISTYRYKFFHQNIESQRLVLNSALAGLIALIIARLTYKLLFQFECIPFYESGMNIFEYIEKLVNYLISSSEEESKIVSVLSFVYSILGIEIYNRFIYKREISFELAIKKSDNTFDYLIYKSLIQSTFEDRLLLITFKNRKVYLGVINKMELPIHDQYINFLPVLSGYRDINTLEVFYTENYSKEIKKLREMSKNGKVSEEDIGICANRSEISAIAQYNGEIFTKITGQTMTIA